MPSNLNAMKNASRLTYRLRIGELPGPLRKQVHFARSYRRDLEAAVGEAKGEVDIVTAHSIDTACAAEVHAAIARWLLRTRLNTMTASDILACSAAVMKAKECRDRAVARLGIARPTMTDAIDALYGPTTPPGATPVAAHAHDATTNSPGDHDTPDERLAQPPQEPDQ